MEFIAYYPFDDWNIARSRESNRENNCHLAVSLHSPFEEERLGLMPAEKQFPMKRSLNF